MAAARAAAVFSDCAPRTQVSRQALEAHRPVPGDPRDDDRGWRSSLSRVRVRVRPYRSPVTLGAAAAWPLVQPHDPRDIGGPRDGPLRLLPAIQRRRDAALLPAAASLAVFHGHAGRGDQDPRTVSDPDSPVRHWRRGTDRRVHRARPGAVHRVDDVDRSFRCRPERTSCCSGVRSSFAVRSG